MASFDAHGRLSFVQTECRTGNPLHHGRHLLQAARGTGESIEVLETEQGEENADHLVECFGVRTSILLCEPLAEYTQAMAPPFISCPYHLLEVRIECCQRAEPAHHESIRVPEATEDGNVFIQSVERVGATEGRPGAPSLRGLPGSRSGL